jgi:transposase
LGPGPAVEVRVRAVRRRDWSPEERLRIVRETLEPGTVVQTVADRHGVSTGQLYTWRKQMLATAMAGFAPVAVVQEPPPPALPAPAAVPAAVEAAGSLEIVLPSGASIRVTGAVDAVTLRMVLAELGGR